VTVSLRSSGLAAQTPPTVLVPAGKVSAQFNVTTTFVATTQTVTVTAQANGASQAAMLEVDPATAVTLQNLTVDPSAVQGGRSVTATVTLSGTAAGSGATIPITSDSSAIIAPSVITVPFGRQIASATISTSTVTMPQIVTLSAVYGRSSKQATVTVSPAFTLALSSSSVTGGNSVQGSITLGGPQTGIVLFAIASSDPSVIASPATVSITPGQTSASFSLNTMRVNATRTVTVTASSSSFTAIKQSASLAVLAPASAALQSISITPNRVTGGQAATGTLTLTAPAPAGGVTVVLRSSSAAAQLTTSVVLIPQGQAGSNFQITTTPVITTQTSTITATASGVSKTATLTVQ
jgi:hypothetical protein